MFMPMQTEPHAVRTLINRAGGDERLRELILYVAEKCHDDPCFGATMLNKILFFSDFATYLNLGEPITGVEYRALPNGPAPLRLVQNRGKLERDGDIRMVSIPTQRGEQKRVVPLRSHKAQIFTESELAIVDAVIAGLGGFTANDVSEISHGAAWRSVSENDLIPYETAFVSDAEITDDDKRWAMHLAKDDGVVA